MIDLGNISSCFYTQWIKGRVTFLPTPCILSSPHHR